MSSRTAVVTGAGSGLGRAIAEALAKHGLRVLLLGRDAGKLHTAVDDITASGGSARAVRCDVSDPASVARAADETAKEDVSVVVNNAGIPGPVASLTDVEPAEWDEVFAVNVRGVYLVCRAYLPRMIEHRCGDIINIASVSGKRPLAGRTPYTASKMAVIGLTTTLASEVGGYGVSVNSLSPGPVRGPRMERNFRLESLRLGITAAEAEERLIGRAALGRMVEESEVAAAVIAMLQMPGLSAADIDLSAGMAAR